MSNSKMDARSAT